MRYLRLGSLVILICIITSCARFIPEGYHRQKNLKSELSSLPSFVNSSSLQKYDMFLEYKDTNFSGMMLIKKIDDISCRLVLTSYLGLTIFNLEISKDNVIVNQCIDPLNKKSILELFAKDIEILMAYYSIDAEKIKLYKKDNSYTQIESISNTYYTIDTKEKRLLRVQQRGIFGKKDLRFISDSKVEIYHPLIGLRIVINSLK